MRLYSFFVSVICKPLASGALGKAIYRLFELGPKILKPNRPASCRWNRPGPKLNKYFAVAGVLPGAIQNHELFAANQ